MAENQKSDPNPMRDPSGKLQFATSPFWPDHLLNLFFRPRKFFSSLIEINKTPYFLFVTWCFGMSNIIQRIENQMIGADLGRMKSGWREILPYLVESWPYFWGFVLVTGALGGALIWLIGGWWYRLRIKWSGHPEPDKRLARLTYVYASFIATGTYVFLTLIYTIFYQNFQQAWAADNGISLIWIIFPFWSCIVSYKGVTTLFDLKKLRAALWFLVFPALAYVLVLGVMATMFALYGKYAYHAEPEWYDFEGGVHLIFKIAANEDGSIDNENAAAIREILSERLDQFGIRNKILRVESDGLIIVQTPYYENFERLINLLMTPANFEFRLVDDRNDELVNTTNKIPPDSEILYRMEPAPSAERVIKTPLLVKKKALLTGAHIKNADVSIDSQYNEPYIAIEFDEDGSTLLERITGENIRRRLAIVIDKRVYSAPVIQEKISGGEARITGKFSDKEAADLALLFRTGPLPAKIMLVEQKMLNKEIWLGSTGKGQE